MKNVSTDILFMAPDGKLLDKAGNYSSEGTMLRTMLKVLEKNPDYAKPSPEEEQIKSAADKADVCIDLQDYVQAKKILKDEKSDYAYYLQGRIARIENNWVTMEKCFKEVRDRNLKDDIAMERAYKFWHEEDFKKLAAYLAAFTPDNKRYSEAKYYEGLAHYHQKEIKKADKIWNDAIKSCKEDRWVYRMDWARYGALGGSTDGVFTSEDKQRSTLGRIGYMKRMNPDLVIKNTPKSEK